MAETTEQTGEVEEQPQQLFYNSDEIKEAAKDDMDLFGGLVCPEDLIYEFPDFYRFVWQIVIQSLIAIRDFSKFALGFPRGHGKTMVVKLMVVFAILFTNKRYILVIGANQKKARAIISDVCDMLDGYNIQQLFGNWRYQIEQDTQDLKKFSFNGRNIILEAAGQGTAIRGSNQKNERPDFMVFDDAQTAECAKSIVEAEAFRTWFLGTAMKAKSPKGCTYIYIGNMYKDIEAIPGSGIYNCMLRNLQKSQSWTSFIVGGILSDMTALWEELQPIDQLLEEYKLDLEMGQPEIFFSEVLNDPKAQTSMYINLQKIVKRPDAAEDLHQGNFIVIDPATSKQTPDQLVFGYFELFDGVPNYKECHTGKWTAPQTVHFGIDLALKKECSLIVVEDNAYQYSLCEWFEFVLEQMGITGLNIVALSNSGKSKNARIMTYFKTLTSGETTTSEATHAKVVTQAAAFDPLVATNLDDILDTGEMGTRVPKLFPQLIAVPGDLATENLQLGATQDIAPPPLPF